MNNEMQLKINEEISIKKKHQNVPQLFRERIVMIFNVDNEENV